MRFPGLFQSLAAIACIVAFSFTDSVSYMFAAVIFAIGAAEGRILAVIRKDQP